MHPLHYIELSAFSHTSEDPAKVKQALMNATGLTDQKLFDKTFEVEEVKGASGNPMEVLTVTLKNSAAFRAHKATLSKGKAAAALQESSLLPKLLEELDRRMDDDLNVYFRLAKQPMLEGQAVLVRGTVEGDVITVRWKVKVYPADLDKALSAIYEYLS